VIDSIDELVKKKSIGTLAYHESFLLNLQKELNSNEHVNAVQEQHEDPTHEKIKEGTTIETKAGKQAYHTRGTEEAPIETSANQS
jgi:hypothetical protein